MRRMIKVGPWGCWGGEEAEGTWCSGDRGCRRGWGHSYLWGSTRVRGGQRFGGVCAVCKTRLVLALSPARLCHRSFSSLAGCPTPEEKNKKDEAPTLPRRVNRCLSPWELLPPAPGPPGMTSSRHRADRRGGTGWVAADISREDV